MLTRHKSQLIGLNTVVDHLDYKFKPLIAWTDTFPLHSQICQLFSIPSVHHLIHGTIIVLYRNIFSIYVHYFILQMPRHQVIISLLFMVVCHEVQGQLRPMSLPGLFSAMRYQNTACDGENEESGICLYEVMHLKFLNELNMTLTL